MQGHSQGVPLSFAGHEGETGYKKKKSQGNEETTLQYVVAGGSLREVVKPAAGSPS